MFAELLLNAPALHFQPEFQMNSLKWRKKDECSMLVPQAKLISFLFLYWCCELRTFCAAFIEIKWSNADVSSPEFSWCTHKHKHKLY